MAPTYHILCTCPDTKQDSELSTIYLNELRWNNIYYAIYRVAIDIKVSSCIFALPKTYGFSSRSRVLHMSLG